MKKKEEIIETLQNAETNLMSIKAEFNMASMFMNSILLSNAIEMIQDAIKLLEDEDETN